MKLTDVKNEQAVTRILTYVRVLERYLSLTHSAISHDMSFFDAQNMIILKKWYDKSGDDTFDIQITFHLETKQGWALWRANCTVDSDYYSITVNNVSFRLTKLAIPGLFVFGVECRFGFLAFSEVPDSFTTIDLLKGYVDQSDVLFKDMCDAHDLVKSYCAKIDELQSELEDLKQQLADIYWSTQN